MDVFFLPRPSSEPLLGEDTTTITSNNTLIQTIQNIFSDRFSVHPRETGGYRRIENVEYTPRSDVLRNRLIELFHDRDRTTHPLSGAEFRQLLDLLKPFTQAELFTTQKGRFLKLQSFLSSYEGEDSVNDLICSHLTRSQLIALGIELNNVIPASTPCSLDQFIQYINDVTSEEAHSASCLSYAFVAQGLTTLSFDALIQQTHLLKPLSKLQDNGYLLSIYFQRCVKRSHVEDSFAILMNNESFHELCEDEEVLLSILKQLEVLSDESIEAGFFFVHLIFTYVYSAERSTRPISTQYLKNHLRFIWRIREIATNFVAPDRNPKQIAAYFHQMTPHNYLGLSKFFSWIASQVPYLDPREGVLMPSHYRPRVWQLWKNELRVVDDFMQVCKGNPTWFNSLDRASKDSVLRYVFIEGSNIASPEIIKNWIYDFLRIIQQSSPDFTMKDLCCDIFRIATSEQTILLDCLRERDFMGY
ncbi:MAG: hypothetical protein HY860_05890 [Chlamydiales bacterium]|nr:hypothetical protein [Chlamydiales bacterium]